MSASARRVFPWFVVVGVLLTALSLRGPILAPTPVMASIADSYGLDAATAGLVTTAPVIMFAIMTPFAALLVTRAGAERAVLFTLVGIMVGSVLRAIDGFAWLIAGSIVIGASIMIGNIVLPVILRRDVPPARVATVTAAYTAMMNLGSLVTSLATAPLAAVVGWQAAMLVWTSLVVIATVVWAAHIRRARRSRAAPPGARDDGVCDETAREEPALVRAPVSAHTDTIAALTGPLPALPHGAPLWRAIVRPTPIFLLAAFALQCGMYYAVSTWLPSYTADTLNVDASAAGVYASIFQGFGVVGAFLVPLLNRWYPPIVGAGVVAFGWIILMAGLVCAPSLLLVWLVMGGLAQAGGFVVIFSTLVRIAQSDAEAAAMSAVIQGGAYAVAAVAAPVIGSLFDRTGGWTVPFTVLLVASLAYAISMLAAVRTARH